jgi:hypothetical protein
MVHWFIGVGFIGLLRNFKCVFSVENKNALEIIPEHFLFHYIRQY